MKKIFIFFVGMLILMSGYGMLETPSSQQRICLYHPDDVVPFLQPISLEKFKENSDNFYVSIDDFLRDKETNGEEFLRFVDQCKSLIAYDQYKKALLEEIIPDFKEFFETTCPAEIIGCFPEEEVEIFLSFLRNRFEMINSIVPK